CGCHAAGVATNGALTIAGLLAAIALLGARRKDRR
ncbi:LPXTG cell wall anchor domain-containing protein, partial [Clostridioides difficile]|nr:LPXTG cell wall anchor domain-containing protein [Clostridioides difficile]